MEPGSMGAGAWDGYGGRRAFALVALLLLVGASVLGMLPIEIVADTLGTETQITTGSGNEGCVEIYGSKVVYSRPHRAMALNNNRDEQIDDIYLYDLRTRKETLICNAAGTQWEADVYGNMIVWEDGRSYPNVDIYMHNLETGTETQITWNKDQQCDPSIYGRNIVWEDYRNGNWDIYTYNLDNGTETQITRNTFNQSDPIIFGTRVVWFEFKTGNYDVFMYDLSTGTETQITTDTHSELRPAIYGSRIVWEGNLYSNDDIFMYDIDTRTETRITQNTARQWQPDIYGNRIVWEDNRNGNADIYMYDLETCLESQITTDTAEQREPVIYGNRILWEDKRNGNWDIYMYEIPGTTEPPWWPILPTFKATEDIPVTCNFTAFCDDIDTPLEGLSLTSTSPYVTSITGLNVTFLFPNGVLSATVPLSLSDGAAEAVAEVNFTVTPVNDPPTCSAPTEWAATEDEPYDIDFDPYVSDVDNELTDLGLSTDDQYATTTGLHLKVCFPGSVLAHMLWLNLSDGNAQTAIRLHFTIHPVDDPPSISPLPTFQAVVDRPSVFDLAPFITDEDTPLDRFTLIVDDPNCTVDGLKMTFLFGLGGLDLEVPFELVGPGGDRTQGVLSVHVTGNRPPIVRAVPRQAPVEDEPMTLDLSPYIEDEETPAAGLTLACDDPHVTAIDGLTLTLLYHQGGSQPEVAFSVSDGHSITEGSFEVQVKDVNDVPVITGLSGMASPVAIVVREGEERWFTLDVTDEDSTAFTYGVSSSWAGVSVLQNGSVRVKAAAGEVGSYTANLSVDDRASGVAHLALAITVENVNDPPGAILVVAPANHTSVEKGKTITFSVEVDDPDTVLGQVLTVTWTSDVSGVIRTLTSAQGLSFTTADLPAGTHRITVSVTDGQFTREAWFELKVTSKTTPPPNGEEEPSPLAGPLGIAVIVVVLVLVALAIVMYIRSSRRR